MKVRELLSGPEKWTQGWSARQADGTECNSTMDGAVCWCLYGAIKECYPLDDPDVTSKIANAIGTCNITYWNDAPGRTFDDIRQLVTELDI